jgi:hypothetical protein
MELLSKEEILSAYSEIINSCYSLLNFIEINGHPKKNVYIEILIWIKCSAKNNAKQLKSLKEEIEYYNNIVYNLFQN